MHPAATMSERAGAAGPIQEPGRTMSRKLIAAALMSLCVGAPAAAQAQAARLDALVVLVGADTFAVENLTRTADRLQGELTGRAIGRTLYTAVLGPGGSVASLEIEAWQPGVPAERAQVQRIRVALQGDSAIVEVSTPAGAQTQRIGTTAGALPYLNPSFGLVEQVLLRARAVDADRAGVAIPLFMLQGGATLPGQVQWLGADSATFALGGAVLRAHLDAGGRLAGVTVPAQNLTVRRVEGTHIQPVAVTPADYSAPEGAPYRAEHVRVPTPMGHDLAGTLTLPEGSGPFPVMVTITGSGLQDRDQALPAVRGYRPMRDIADALGRRGIAVLRMDDRGFGESGGDAAAATSEDFAQDIAAAVAYLRGRADIDGARVGLIGHSEGGMIAPLVARADASLAGIVLIAAPAHTGAEIIAYQQRYAIERSPAIPAESRDSAFAAAQAEMDRLAALQPWLQFMLHHDPLAVARAVTLVPVLILQGETDRQVTAEQAELLAAAFREGGNPDVTARVFPGINHLMLRDADGNPAGYAQLTDTAVDAELLTTLADWATARLRAAHAH